MLFRSAADDTVAVKPVRTTGTTGTDWIVTEIGLGMGGSDDNVNVMQISTAPLVQTVQCRIRCVNSTQATVQHWTLASPYVMAGWNNQGEIVEGEVAPQGWEIVTFTLPPVDVFEFSVEISVTVGNQMVTGILTYLPYVEQPWAFITQTPLIELTDQVLQCAFVFCSLEGM